MKEGALLTFCEKGVNKGARKNVPGIDQARPSLRFGVVHSLHSERLRRGGAEGGGDGGEPGKAKARTIPDYGELRPQRYVTDEFKPAFSFEVVGGGWVVGGHEDRGVLDMRRGVERPVLSFVNEQRVFDP